MQRDLTAIRAAMLHAHDVLHSARAMLPESDLGHAEIGEAMRGLRDAAALASAPAAEPVAWEYQNQHGNKFLSDTDPNKWHPHDQEGFKAFRALVYADQASHPQAQVAERPDDAQLETWRRMADRLLAMNNNTVNFPVIRNAAFQLQNAYLSWRPVPPPEQPHGKEGA